MESLRRKYAVASTSDPGDERSTVEAEVRRILSTGVTEGRMFILREGNNLAPGTPTDNVAAMYRAAGRYGRYD